MISSTRELMKPMTAPAIVLPTMIEVDETGAAKIRSNTPKDLSQTMSIVWDKSLGVFDRILAAPVSSTSIRGGKTMAGWVMGFISSLVLLIIGYLLFGVSFPNIGLVLLVIVLASFSFTGIGTIISGLASEPREAMMLSKLLRFPMMFLGGVFFPSESMPMPLPYVARALPLTYATEGLRAVMSGNM